MRLTCPNCDARYEVPDEVIPTAGRDVQCSNCGQTWFQHHPDHAPPEEPEEEVTPPDAAPEPDEEVVAPPQPPKPPEPKRRELDPGVADILREEAEAEFEARRRRQAQQPLESQPELGLSTGSDQPDPPLAGLDEEDEDPAERARLAKRRMARMRGEIDSPGEAAAAAAAMSSRRELLPDIEEINSTLRSGTTPSGVDPDAREGLGAGGELKQQKRGFRRGMVLTLLLVAVLALIYVFAPQIAQAVPAVDPLINAYVTWVDQMRIGLDAQVRNLLSWLDAVSAQQAPDS